jgi:hypothetical protein
MSIYLVTVDPGAESMMQLQSFFVDAPDPNAAYDMFWDKCIYDDDNSRLFKAMFVTGDPQDGFILKKENFLLWDYYWGKKDFRVYHEVRNPGDPPIVGMRIIVNKIPTQIKAGYKPVKGV